MFFDSFPQLLYSHRSEGEKEKFFAVTMFAATDARRCFPCWDEPAIKACFDVSLAVDRDKVALSNMVNWRISQFYTLILHYSIRDSRSNNFELFSQSKQKAKSEMG